MPTARNYGLLTWFHSNSLAALDAIDYTTPTHPSKKRPTKRQRVLTALLRRPYNLFEAERELHDRSLHSTVSSIQNQHGVSVARCFETVSGYQGTPTRVVRYWIAEEHREAAERLLQQWGGPA